MNTLIVVWWQYLPKLSKSKLMTTGISFNRFGAVGKTYVSDKRNFAKLYG